ncbi:NAD(P)/FAD-dependent oxidoreductase [Microbaculum sp. FT89]|uniref:NAD(P)/FAD-dependent oxidoreductase n=1 Tax=Microbaculum sp. FT89 TaxID=3447298 RepID=UPI003F53359F
MSAGVVIVGGGHGASQLAASLRQEGYDGRVVLVSDENELPYHKPPLSKTFLKAAEPAAQMLRPAAFYRDKTIDLELGVRVDAIERPESRVRLSDGRTIPFGHLVLATGARPRVPPLPGVDLQGVLPLRCFADAGVIREALVDANAVAVIGGGFIGMEIAHTLSALGRAVTVFEMSDRVLGRSVAPSVSSCLMARANASSLDVRTRCHVSAMEGDSGHVRNIRLSDGTRLHVDLVILGTGVVPNSELGAVAGLRTDDGIVVDEALRSSDPHILAIGDVARYHHAHAQRSVRLESVQNANDQARHAARTIVGRPAPYSEVPWFWSDLGDTKLQIAGLSIGADRWVLSGEPEVAEFSVWHFTGPRLVAVDSLNRAADHMIARRLLAAGISPAEEDIHAGKDRLKELAAGN